MGRSLIYLGNKDSCALLALADLDNLTPCTVPVKKVPRTEFNNLRRDSKIHILGAVGSSTEITTATYVRVAVMQIKDINLGSAPLKLVHVFISGSGKLRVLHTDFMQLATKYTSFLMRQNVVGLSVSSIMCATAPHDPDETYSDFFPPDTVYETQAYLAQKLLLYGLLCDVTSFGAVYIYPVDSQTYTASNSYSVQLPKLFVPSGCSSLTLQRLSLTIDEAYIYGRVRVSNDYKSKVHINKLYASAKSDVMLGEIGVSKIIGRFTYETDKVVNSGKISFIAEYSGEDMLREAGLISLSHCFNAKDAVNTLDGDVVIPDWVSLTCCFDFMCIKGKVHCGKGVYVLSSFNDAECQGVLFDGDEDSEIRLYQAPIQSSFRGTAIHGNVDVQRSDRISSSFTGVITGEVLLHPNLQKLHLDCFTEYRDKNFTLNPVTREFAASLRCAGATLTVIGDEGSFKSVSVDNLVWDTAAKSVTDEMFSEAEQVMSNEVPSVTVLNTGSFKNFRGKKLDLRNFINLETIESRAVNACENLTVLLVSGALTLMPSAFARCKRLSHIYIGDDIKSVPASVFYDLAPVVNIYYNQNKAVERLGRIPRFKLHPNSTPEDAMAVLVERADMLETASVVATFAGLNHANYGAASQSQTPVLQAVELSMSETGISSELTKRYPIIPKCSKSISDIAWVSGKQIVTKNTVNTTRAEAVRTLVGCALASYPYCEAVLKYKVNDIAGELVLDSDEYSFICNHFLVSGDRYWAYVIVDKLTKRIIHAFTVGAIRNEIAEIAKYMSFIPASAKTCAVLRYAEEVKLISYYSSEFSSDFTLRVHEATAATWLPFGSFKVGTKYGIYGVDLYTGDCVIYSYATSKGAEPTSFGLSSVSEWWGVRLHSKGIKYTGSIEGILTPKLVGTADTALERLVVSDELKEVKVYDTTKIPLARDITKTRELLELLKDTNSDYTIKQVIELMVWSELFQKDGRIATHNLFKDRYLEKTVYLQDGVLRFYSMPFTQLNVANFLHTDSKKELWYTMISQLPLIIDLLSRVSIDGAKNVSPATNKYHYSLTDKYENVSINFLSARVKHIPRNSNIIMRKATCLCLGVSNVSFKACLYWEKVPAFYHGRLDEASITIILWFNSLMDAYKALGEFDFAPFSAVPYTNTMANMANINIDSEGRITKTNNFRGAADIVGTRDALMGGKPDNYILQSFNCSQTLFDLSCKQPKSM